MIKRTILDYVTKSVKFYPVTLITGARQVGKSTLARLFIEKGFSYVSLDDSRECELAIKDPQLFLNLHPWPLIIDEIQKAPILFSSIEEIVNKEKMKNNDNHGMYILTGSQVYKLMKGVSESMSGRVWITHMQPLSRNETIGRDDPIFSIDIKKINKRAKTNPLPLKELYKNIVRGFYPELHANKELPTDMFYSSYVETYLERDVSEIINVKDKFAFRRFMELLASLTGQELVYDNLAKEIGVDIKTIKSWVSVLLAGDIIYLLKPYNEYSVSKRVVKRPKIYFSDTGLASYLARVSSPETLQASFLNGRFVETYIINELRKSYLNNGKAPNFYYYRDASMHEIDLIILEDATLYRIECKAGINYSLSDIKSFIRLEDSKYSLGTSGIICNTDSIYPLNEDAFVLPLAGI